MLSFVSLVPLSKTYKCYPGSVSKIRIFFSVIDAYNSVTILTHIRTLYRIYVHILVKLVYACIINMETQHLTRAT
jgi:hypothetical protein